MLGGGVGRVPRAPAKKKSDVAERLSFGLRKAVRVSLREGGGGGVGVGGPGATKGEPKKAAVLLLPLEETSGGEGRGEGKRPSETPTVRIDNDFMNGFMELGETASDEATVACAASGMGVGRRVQASMAGSVSRRFCLLLRRSSATIAYILSTCMYCGPAELTSMAETGLGLVAAPLHFRKGSE